jgi:hypothetical protein
MPSLPNAALAVIDPRKFSEYSLNPFHANNRGKWVGFRRLGFDLSTPEAREAAARELIGEIRAQLPNADATESRHSRPHDRRFDVRVTLRGPNGVWGTLHTAWQIVPGSRGPTLVTNWMQVHEERGQSL